MTMTRHTAPLVACLLAAVLIPADVSAQLIGENEPPPESMRRPYRGLFGSPGDPQTPQSLILSASLFGAYDDNVASGLLEGSNNIDPRLQESGTYSGANVGLNYSISRTLE